MDNVVLSIITPYYDTLKYIMNLYSVLSPQLNKKVEWIIIDDGCHEIELDKISSDCVSIIHLEKNSGNASLPRNVGIDNAKGKYIAFVDSDDLVENNYIETILNKINTKNFDYCIISWRTKDSVYILDGEPPEWNKCVWNTIYKKDIIGNERFDIDRNLGEDGDFNNRVRKGKRVNILEPIYLYNWKREGSISNRYSDGLIPFQKNSQ